MEDVAEEKFTRTDRAWLQCRAVNRDGESEGSKEVPFTNVISRHVKQVTDFNKALEKRQLWKEREKELAAKHEDTWGVLKAEGRSRRSADNQTCISRSARRVLDSLNVEGVDKEVVEKVKEKVARTFGSVDVHSATRQRIAKQKEARQLQLQNEGSDAWMPDRFYTEELKQKTPWLNPVEFLSELHPPQREGSLTPVASASDSGNGSSNRKRKKEAKRKKGKKKKCEKRRGKDKKAKKG